MDFYLDERQRRKRRRLLKLKIYGGLFLFFALIIGAGYLVVYSSIFQIKQITLINADNPEAEQARYGAGKQINADNIIENLKDFFTKQSKITKFLGPDNILVWKEGNTDGILKNYPQIAEIAIKKDYLERQIKIEVTEREKLGIWCAGSATAPAFSTSSEQLAISNQQLAINQCMWFDKNGIIFEEAPFVEGNLINNVDDLSGRSLNLGDLVLEEKFYSNLFKIFDVLEKSDLGIKSLKLERIELQEILTESSPKIYFSLRVDPGFTLAAIDSMKNIGLEKIEYIDLRVENRAYYKLK